MTLIKAIRGGEMRKNFRVLHVCFVLVCVFILQASSFAAEAKVFQIKAQKELLTGVKAQGKIGDYKLSNGKAAFVIEGMRVSSGYSMYGGTLLDAVRTDVKDSPGDMWGEAFPIYMGEEGLFDVRTMNPTKMEIVQEGGKDKDAILRVTAEDVPLPIVEEFLGKKTNPQNFIITIDYVLKPDADYLILNTSVKDKDGKPRDIIIGDAFIFGDTMQDFAIPFGYDSDKFTKKPADLFGVTGSAFSDKISYGIYSPDSGFTFSVKYQALYFGFYKKYKIPADGEAKLSQYYFVGNGDIESIQKSLVASDKLVSAMALPLSGMIQGTVMEGNKPLSDARIHITTKGAKSEEYVTLVKPDKNGKYEAIVEAGKEYKVSAYSFDRKVPDAKTVTPLANKPETLNFTFDAPAALSFDVKDDKKQNIPAMLAIEKKDGMEKTPAMFGEKREAYGNYYRVYFTKDGKGKIPVAPGKYKITFSRGLEYEIDVKDDVTLESGKETALSAVLAHSVDTTNFVSADFHLHSMPSPDSNDLFEDKIIGYAGHGLEIPVATDHDVITDYTPVIKKLGLEKYMRSMVGEELTTMKLGHFQGYPLKYEPDKRNNGAPDWYGLKTGEIFSALRLQGNGEDVVQINHPRSGGMGYLSAIGYDPKTGKAILGDQFDLTFDALEIFNGKGAGELPVTSLDWYSFLNQGMKKAALGNSDSHHIYNLEAGYPRNFCLVGKDDPQKVTDAEIVKAVKGLHVSVSGGSFVQTWINGSTMGDMVTTKDVKLKVKVQAPSWMDVKKLTVVANGKEIQNVDIPDSKNVVRYNGELLFKPEKDTWYVVIVTGEKDLSPVYPGAHAYSFTNPIFVDVDGNGKFDAPGL